MNLRYNQCIRCEKAFDIQTGKRVDYDPEFYQKKGICDPCFKEIKPLIDLDYKVTEMKK